MQESGAGTAEFENPEEAEIESTPAAAAAAAAEDCRMVRSSAKNAHPPSQAIKCPRCESMETKFCYYNNYSLTQPRYFCKNCKRYWTAGGALRNVPVGGGLRKNKRTKLKLAAAAAADVILTAIPSTSAADASMHSGSDSVNFLISGNHYATASSPLAPPSSSAALIIHHPSSLYSSGASSSSPSPSPFNISIPSNSSSLDINHLHDNNTTHLHCNGSVVVDPAAAFGANYFSSSTSTAPPSTRIHLPRLNYYSALDPPPNYFNLLLSAAQSSTAQSGNDGVGCSLRDLTTPAADVATPLIDEHLMIKQEIRDADVDGNSGSVNTIPATFIDNSWHLISDGIFSAGVGDGFFYPLPGSGGSSNTWPDFSDQFNDLRQGDDDDR